MPVYQYRARNPGGQSTTGTIEAADRPGALGLLAQQRLYPTSLEPAKGSSTGKAVDSHEASSTLTLRNSERLLFTEQLGQLLRAGMRIESALTALAKRLSSPKLKTVCENLRAAVVDGQPLSTAMQSMPRCFDNMYTGLVRAGEAGGALGTILENLAAHLRRMASLRDQVSQALIYPAFLVIAGVGMILVFMLVMVPQLTDFFARSGGTMPMATQILIASSEFIGQWWWFGVLLLVAAGVALFVARQNPVQREKLDALALKIPFTGSILTNANTARIARTLASLLNNGLTLLSAIGLLEKASANLAIRSRLRQVRLDLANGASFSGALQNAKEFPELFVDMTALGEQTGQLPNALDSAGEIHEGELSKRIRRLTALLPPILILVIAILAGLVVFSILSAVFDMTSSLRTRMQ